jgi:hypothetical protein
MRVYRCVMAVLGVLFLATLALTQPDRETIHRKNREAWLREREAWLKEALAEEQRQSVKDQERLLRMQTDDMKRLPSANEFVRQIEGKTIGEVQKMLGEPLGTADNIRAYRVQVCILFRPDPMNGVPRASLVAFPPKPAK